MADYRQLAREFVLEDDAAKLTGIAQRAAAEIQNAPAQSNPVARWVEAVQPWMPGNNDDANDVPDWASRGKALEFLSRTLDFLSLDLLGPSQVKLLVAFFCAMFDVDHKAGVPASATALSRIVAMKSFQPSSGHDIITKTCALQDDFPRQAPKTRLAVYQLLRSLIHRPDVSRDLQRRAGPDAAFMAQVVDLCRSERDPDCLDVWFDTLAKFLATYRDVTDAVVDKTYQAFHSYFPITVPRKLQTGVTTDDLKLRLRSCFSSTHRLSRLAIPFLVEKLDQGYGVTVNVKLDVLKTIKACLEEYADPEESILPHVLRLWTCLKYEVRNGDVEDTIWATLEVLKTLALRLQDEHLRDYTLNVTRDCVDDLSNPVYTARAGRLLVSVLSASPTAFVLMVAPIITHIKENIRRPKSPAHSQDLFRLLLVTLEARVLLADAAMSSQDRSDFAAIDAIFRNLFDDVYKAALHKTLEEDDDGGAAEDDLQIAAVAAQGAGALLSARTAAADKDLSSLLLAEGTRSQICRDLFSILQRSLPGAFPRRMPDELVNESVKALQRAVKADPRAFKPLVDQALTQVRSDEDPHQTARLAETVQTLGPLLAYVGCSEAPSDPADGMHNFLYLLCQWTRELAKHMDRKSDPRVWCAFLVGIQSIARNLHDALPKPDPAQKTPTLADEPWTQDIVQRYPALASLSAPAEEDEATGGLPEITIAGPRQDFLLIGLFVVRHLYRRATTSSGQAEQPALRLSDDFSGAPQASHFQYLSLLSSLASFIVHELDETQQSSLSVERYALNLFQEEVIPIPRASSDDLDGAHLETLAAQHSSPWGWLLEGRVNVLALGLLEGFRATGVRRLFDSRVPFELLVYGTSSSPRTPDDNPWTQPVARSILAVLSNKYTIEDIPGLMDILKGRLTTAISNARYTTTGAVHGEESPASSSGSSTLDQASSVIAIAGGLLRRYAGKSAKLLVDALGEVPADPLVGHHLARRLEAALAPQEVLAKENHAVVKPIWLQRVYVELVKPMVLRALGGGSPTTTITTTPTATATTTASTTTTTTTAAADTPDKARLIRSNFGIAVLLAVKHLPFSVYDEDASAILRIAISAAQTLGPAAEKLAALRVFKDVLAAAPLTAQAHLHSLVGICIACLGRGGRAAADKNTSTTAPARPTWMPEDYLPRRPAAAAGCERLALEILAALPVIYAPEKILAFGPKVRKELCVACGHGVRELRGRARDGCAAWAEIR